jgi:putative ABC transport system permease protein
MRVLLSIIQLSLETLMANKLRSLLTVLGVIIGTGTIIGVGSILAGLDNSVGALVKASGADTIFVFKARVGFVIGGYTPEEIQRKPLTFDDARAIAERCPSVAHVSPYLVLGELNRGSRDRARYRDNETFQMQIAGTDENYLSSGQAEIDKGRFFTETENQHRMPLVVIGADFYGALFGFEDAVGKRILVDGLELEVIGVMKRPSNALPGQTDNRVLLPYNTMRKMFPQAREHVLFVEPRPTQTAAAIDELTAVLRQRRHVAFSAPDNFSVSTPDQIVAQFRDLTSVTALVMVVLSSVGLLVGGIGVMNIMLVSVTERTREIGVRKAIGARRRDIVLQFLTEAVVLTSVGGVLGMTLGWGISVATRLAFPSLQAMVPGWAVAVGSLTSVAIGLFFGIWPANKAARLDPVEALRHE